MYLCIYIKNPVDFIHYLIFNFLWPIYCTYYVTWQKARSMRGWSLIRHATCHIPIAFFSIYFLLMMRIWTAWGVWRVGGGVPWCWRRLRSIIIDFSLVWADVVSAVLFIQPPPPPPPGAPAAIGAYGHVTLWQRHWVRVFGGGVNVLCLDNTCAVLSKHLHPSRLRPFDTFLLISIFNLLHDMRAGRACRE